RSGCAGRHHGRNHGRGGNSISPAQYFAWTRRLVAAGAVLQAGLSPEDARSAGVAGEPEDQAGGSGGCNRGDVGRAVAGRWSSVVSERRHLASLRATILIGTRERRTTNHERLVC